MEFAEAINSFLSKYKYLFGRVRGIEVLFCIIEFKEGDNKVYYNFYTRAYGVESVTNNGPMPIQCMFPLLKKGSRVELNRSSNLLLFGWKTDTGAFFEWLKRYSAGTNTVFWPGEGDNVLHYYLETPMAFVNYEPDTMHYFKGCPYTAELRIPGDREAITGVITDGAVGEAIEGVQSRLKIDLIEDTTPNYGGLDVIIPETRYAVKWRGAPPKNERGFLIRLLEREPEVLTGAALVLRDRENDKVFLEKQRTVSSTRIYVPGFMPEHLCNVNFAKGGVTLYDDENFLIKEFVPDIKMITGRRKLHFKKKGLDDTVEVDIVSSMKIRGPNPDKDHNTIALAAAIQRGEDRSSFIILEAGNRREGISKVRRLVAKARSYVKVLDPYLNAFDVALLSAPIRGTDVEVRGLTGYRLPPQEKVAKKAEKTNEDNGVSDSGIDDIRFVREQSVEDLESNFRRLCGSGKSLRWNIRIRGLRGGAYKFHDRFLIVDGNVWAIGTSFNNIGAELSTIIMVDDGVIVEARFDEIWRSIEEEISTFG